MAELYGHTTHSLRISTNIEAFQGVAENENLTKKDLRVFMFLCCRLSSKHIVKVDVKQTASTLNLEKDEVKDCIKHLINENIIEKDSDSHIEDGYRFIYTKERGSGWYDKKA